MLSEPNCPGSPAKCSMEADQHPVVRGVSEALGVRLQEVAEQAGAYARQARAANTRKAYQCDWRAFTSWCDAHNLPPLPADPRTVVLYLADVADAHKVSTLRRRLASISQAHKLAGFPSPALTSQEPLHSVWRGLLRDKAGTERIDKVAPTLPEDLRLMISHLPRVEPNVPMSPPTLSARRDRALLLLGFAGALRRSELVRLNIDDLTFTAEGLRIVVRKSKTDPHGQGHIKGIRYGEHPDTCPVRAIRGWLRAAGIEHGPIFRAVNRGGNVSDRALSGRSVALIIKRACRRAGLREEDFSGHSLRAGFTTQAARVGKPERVIMRHTGHKSERMVREYIREGTLFQDNPTEGLGL